MNMHRQYEFTICYSIKHLETLPFIIINATVLILYYINEKTFVNVAEVSKQFLGYGIWVWMCIFNLLIYTNMLRSTLQNNLYDPSLFSNFIGHCALKVALILNRRWRNDQRARRH